MGSTTKTNKAWAKTTKKEWVEDVIEGASIVAISDDDVKALASEDEPMDADIIRAFGAAATANRAKLTLLVREYGRAYCDEQDQDHKGTGKAQAAYVGKHIEAIIRVAEESEKAKPVTEALVKFASKFHKEFAK